MPRRTDPGSRLTLVLACDIDKPKETQPKFFGRVLSVRQSEELLAKRNQEGGKSISSAVDMVMMFLTGWENMTCPDTGESLAFSADNLKEVLTMEELLEVLDFATGTIKPSAGDQKKSESPPS